MSTCIYYSFGVSSPVLMLLPYMLRVYGIVYAVDWVELYVPWPILKYISLADSIIYFPGRFYYIFTTFENNFLTSLEILVG